MGKKITDEERAIMKRVYPTGGLDAAVKAIPGRTRASLATLARQLGLKLSKETLSEVRSKNALYKGPRRPIHKAKPIPTIDTVPPEFKAVASVFHIGERITK